MSVSNTPTQQENTNMDTFTKTTTCEWFALCTKPAAGTVAHPILGDVPICERCAERMGYADKVKPNV